MTHRSGITTGLACLFLAAGIATAEDAPKKTVAKPAQCTHAPGSHIRLATPADCAKTARGPYRSYSKEDIENTGKTDLAEALRQLDPAFR